MGYPPQGAGRGRGWKKGADVASANDLVLGNDGNVFFLTGVTQINAIATAGWVRGDVVLLLFDTNITVKHNTAGGAGTAVIKFQGAADFTGTADDALIVVYDGTIWRGIVRVNI